MQNVSALNKYINAINHYYCYRYHCCTTTTTIDEWCSSSRIAATAAIFTKTTNPQINSQDIEHKQNSDLEQGP